MSKGLPVSEVPPPIPVQYVVSYEKPKINHLLHLILTLITFGLWIPVWIGISIYGATTQNQKVSGVYGAAYPGHPGAAGVPVIPGSQKAMMNPRPKPPTPRDRRADLKSRAWGIAWIGLAVAFFTCATLWPVGPIAVLMVTAGLVGFVLWRREQIAVDPVVEDTI